MQPAHPGLALPRVYRGKGCLSHCPERLCRSCCLVWYFHHQPCINHYISHRLSYPGALQPWLPTPSHPFPPLPAAMGDGAGSPSLSPAQMACSQPSVKYQCGSCRTGLSVGYGERALAPLRSRGHFWREVREKTGSNNGGLAASTGLSKYLKSLF